MILKTLPFVSIITLAAMTNVEARTMDDYYRLDRKNSAKPTANRIVPNNRVYYPVAPLAPNAQPVATNAHPMYYNQSVRMIPTHVKYMGIADNRAEIFGDPTIASLDQKYSWDGFYIGAQMGSFIAQDKSDYSAFDKNNTDLFKSSIKKAHSFSLNGIEGGAYIGYNNIVFDNALIGVEADIILGSAKGNMRNIYKDLTYDHDNKKGSASFYGNTKYNWSGALRMRAGFAFDNLLFYFAPGIAYANLSTSGEIRTQRTGDQNVYLAGEVPSADYTALGWTAGAGLEYAVTKNVIIRGEYRYCDYGKKEFTSDLRTQNNANTYMKIDKVIAGSDIRIGVGYKF